MINDHYYYHKLNGIEQEAYKVIYKAITQREKEAIFCSPNLSMEDVFNIYKAIILDNPHLYYIDYGNIMVSKDSNGMIRAQIRQVYSEEQCKKLDGLLEKYAKTILQKIDFTGKDVSEQIHAVHDLLASNVVYDHDVAEERAAVEDIHFSHTILGVILRKKAVCDGIAKSFKYLLNAIGIRCIVVTGNADNDMYNNEDHAWNIVKIGEHSYHIDVTNDTNSTESGFICQDYYCLNDELINRDHSNYKGMPICDSLEENMFYKNGAIIKNNDDMDVFIKNKLASGSNRAYFMLDYVDDMVRVANDIQESVAGYIMQKGTKAKIFTVSNEKMRTVMLTVEEF
ncbi:transglutaminase domain-containing protein [Butyrivibrio sp. AE3004]|uniref:transglutaminase domain-containing protein n=1 Tax=Butyrivibrio sp. AE3004 TaxID=1506994 RepID=UPI000493CEE3|nr:transglutaminase domain-containing protein [Butyrivibrio sp. AE3004]